MSQVPIDRELQEAVEPTGEGKEQLPGGGPGTEPSLAPDDQGAMPQDPALEPGQPQQPTEAEIQAARANMPNMGDYMTPPDWSEVIDKLPPPNPHGSISGITDWEYGEGQYQQLSFWEKRWYNYSASWNTIKGLREREDDNPINYLFGEGSFVGDELDNSLSSWLLMVPSSFGKVTLNTLNFGARLLDGVGAIDLEAIEAIDDYRYGLGQGGELPRANEVYGQRSHGAQYIEPIVMFAEQMVMAWSLGTVFAPGATAAANAGWASPTLGVTGGARAGGALTGRTGWFVAGAAADVSVWDIREGNLTTMGRESGVFPEWLSDSSLAMFMDSKYHYENDDQLLAHIVNAGEGGLVGEGLFEVFRALGGLYRGFNAIGQGADQAGMASQQGMPSGIMGTGGFERELKPLLELPKEAAGLKIPAVVQARARKLQAMYVVRVKKYKTMLEEGLTAEEAWIRLEQDPQFSMQALSNNEGKALIVDAMSTMTNSPRERWIPVIDEMVDSNSDLSKVMIDNSEILSQNAAMEMLEAGAYASTRGTAKGARWSQDAHDSFEVTNKAQDKRADSLGKAMAEGRVNSANATEINAFIKEQAGGEALLKGSGRSSATSTIAQREAYKAYVDRAKSWKGVHSRTARAAAGPDRLVGAPPLYKGLPYDDAARESQIEDIIRTAERGLDGRFWYEESGKYILRMMGGNVKDAEKFVQLLAVTSPRTPVDQNWRYAQQYWQMWKDGKDIRWSGMGEGPVFTSGKNKGKRGWKNPGPGADSEMARKAWDILEHELPWNGVKTNNFYRGLMREIDPDLFTQAGWMARFGEDFIPGRSVIDTHMLGEFGYATRSPTDPQYAFAEGMVREAMERINSRLPKGARAFTADQIQAQVWTARVWDTKTYPKWKTAADKAVAAGKEPPPMPAILGESFSDVAGRARSTTVMEMIPGDGRLAGMVDAPEQVRVAYTNDIQRAIAPDGVDRLADALGLHQPRVPGADDGIVGSSVSFDTATLHHSEMKEALADPIIARKVNDYLIGRALLERPGEISWYGAFDTASNEARGRSNAIDFVLDRPMNTAMRDEVYTALTTKYGDEAFGVFDISATSDGFRLINFDTNRIPLGKDFHAEINQLFRELDDSSTTNFRLAIDEATGSAHPPRRFQAVGHRYTPDWNSDPSGMGLIDGLSTEGRSDVLKVIGDEIGPRVQAVNEHWAARTNTGDAGRLQVGENTVAADGRAAAELGHNGTLASAEDGVIHGLARMHGGGITLINATSRTRFIDGVHELGHALRNQLGEGMGELDAAMTKEIEDAFGVVEPGVWTRDNEEAFAEAWEAKFLRGEAVPNADSPLNHLAAFMRDLYRETGRTSMWAKMSEPMREAMGRLATRSLPLQYAPGKYLPAQDWSEIVAKAELHVGGRGTSDWMDMVEPDDIMGRARMPKTGATDELGRPIERTKEDFSFDLDTDEDMFKYMALIEDLTRAVRNKTVGAGRRSDASRDADALRLFNHLLGRGSADIDITMREMMTNHDFLTEDLDSKIGAMRLALAVQLKRVTQLAEKSATSRSVMDYAKLQRQFFQFQVSQAFVKRMMNQTGRGLRAWSGQTKIPTWDQIRTAEGAAEFMEELGVSMKSGDELAQNLRGLQIPEDARAAVVMTRTATEGPMSYAINAFHEVFINGLLSAVATAVTIASTSPIFVNALQGMGHWAGAAIRGDRMQMDEVFDNLRRNVENAKASWMMAGRTFMKEESTLMPGRSLVDRTDRRAIAMQFDDNWLQKGVNHMLGAEDSAVASGVGKTVAGTVNATGAVVRMPTRVIQFFDEGFRQMNGRTAMQAKISDDMYNGLEAAAMKDGTWLDEAGLPIMANPTYGERIKFRQLHGEQVAIEVQKQMDSLIRDGRLRTRQVIVQEVMDGKAILTAEMAADNPQLARWIGKPIKQIPNAGDQALATFRYVDANYTARHRELITHGEQKATQAVFQSDPGEIGALIQQIVDHPLLLTAPRIIMPFVRTPGNIIKTWGGTLPSSILVEQLNRLISGTPKAIRNRSFSGVWDLDPDSYLSRIHKGTMDDLMSGDPRRMADARGRQATGVVTIIGAWGAMEAGLMTGGGPKNADLRRQQMDDGWRPYSIWVPGKGYMSYMRLDPIAPSLALIADTIELLEAEEGKGDHTEKMYLMQALVMSLKNQLAEKTFFQGIGDLFKIKDQKSAEKWAIRLGEATTQPYSSLQRNIRDVQDPVIREMRSLLDARREHSFFYNPEDAPPSRNVLGEVRMRHTQATLDLGTPFQWFNMANIARWSSESKDPLYHEMNILQTPMAGPSETHMQLPLTAFTGGTRDYKFTAHDRRAELTETIEINQIVDGVLKPYTLRKYLEQWVLEGGKLNGAYEKMTGADPVTGYPRKAAHIKGIIAEYTGAAFQQTRTEFPVLDHALNIIEKKKGHLSVDELEQQYGESSATEKLRRLVEDMP